MNLSNDEILTHISHDTELDNNEISVFYGDRQNIKVYEPWIGQQMNLKQKINLPYPLFCNPILDTHPHLFQSYLNPLN